MYRLIKQFILPGLLGFSFLLFSCGNKNIKTDTPIDPDDTLKGRVVVEMNFDSTPKKVYYYDVDERGMTTDNVNHEIHYYPGKKKHVEGDIKNNLREGLWYAYFENGNVQTKAFYINGKEHGDYLLYHENGGIYQEGKYDNGICIDKLVIYDEKGKVIKTLIANDTTIICGRCPRCNNIRDNIKRK